MFVGFAVHWRRPRASRIIEVIFVWRATHMLQGIICNGSFEAQRQGESGVLQDQLGFSDSTVPTFLCLRWICTGVHACPIELPGPASRKNVIFITHFKTLHEHKGGQSAVGSCTGIDGHLSTILQPSTVRYKSCLLTGEKLYSATFNKCHTVDDASLLQASSPGESTRLPRLPFENECRD